MWDDYHVFLLAPLETNKLAKWWVLPPHWITAWLIDYWMLICLLCALILHFGKGILKRESGGFELPKTITLVLQGKRLTKCASHPIFRQCLIQMFNHIKTHLLVFDSIFGNYVNNEKYIDIIKPLSYTYTYKKTYICKHLTYLLNLVHN